MKLFMRPKENEYNIKIVDIRKVLIVTSSPKMANYYAKLNNWPEWEYVSSINTFLRQHNVRICFCGAWQYRKDERRVYEFANEMVEHGLAIIIKSQMSEG